MCVCFFFGLIFCFLLDEAMLKVVFFFSYVGVYPPFAKKQRENRLLHPHLLAFTFHWLVFWKYTMIVFQPRQSVGGLGVSFTRFNRGQSTIFFWWDSFLVAMLVSRECYWKFLLHMGVNPKIGGV